MRAIYLLRHGEPAFKDNRKYCLGRMDLPLSEKGIFQAKGLQDLICGIPDRHVITSPQIRAADTCRYAGIEDFEIREGFAEIGTGEWDGLAFEEIKKQYPEEYEARGADLLNTAPPGGESFAECYERSAAALAEMLEQYPTGNLVIFTHGGVMKMLNAFLTGTDREGKFSRKYDYCTAVGYLMDKGTVYEGPPITPRRAVPEIMDGTEDGELFGPGTITGILPDEDECEQLLKEYGTPPHVREHCRAVAAKALEICRELKCRGIVLNEAAVQAAALLHDLARTKKDHAKEGAIWLNARGYAALAAIVGDHMSLPEEEERISEKSVVFLADKYVKGTADVSLYQRYFPEGLTEDQRGFHKRKYDQAVRIAGLYESD